MVFSFDTPAKRSSNPGLRYSVWVGMVLVFTEKLNFLIEFFYHGFQNGELFIDIDFIKNIKNIDAIGKIISYGLYVFILMIPK